MATREGNHYVVNGRKIYISGVEESDLMILLTRTTPFNDVEKRSRGLSVFLVDLRDAEGLTIKPRRVMMNNLTSELVFDGLRVPGENLIGEEGEGFRYILDGMNAERILIAAECIGDGRWFVEKATERAGEREVFGGRIGENQGVQFPIARAYANVEAASLMVEKAASLFDRDETCGAETNLAKLLAADASWEAANVAVQTFGSYVFDAGYDVERKFRETRLYQVAPSPRTSSSPTSPSTSSASRGLSDGAATRRHYGRLSGAGGRRAVCHAPARRHGRGSSR